jgi:hypothetical protein
MTAARLIRPRAAAWLPAALLVAYALVAASGFSLTPNSGAATGTATVNATVLPEVHMNFPSCGSVTDPDGAGPLAGDAVIAAPNMSSSDGDISLGTCAVTFGSNNNGTNGASLTIANARPAGGTGYAMCQTAVTLACAAPGFSNSPTAGENLVAFNAASVPATGRMGIKASSLTCPGAGADWSTATNYYGLPALATPSTICDTNSTTDGGLTLDFRADPGSSQAAGAYTLKANLVATAT